MWSRKSSEWETELETIRGETAKHEQASHDYAVTGSKILELASQLQAGIKSSCRNCRRTTGPSVVSKDSPEALRALLLRFGFLA